MQTDISEVGGSLDLLRSVSSTTAVSCFPFVPFNMWFRGQPETRTEFKHRNWDFSLVFSFLFFSLSGNSGCPMILVLFSSASKPVGFLSVFEPSLPLSLWLRLLSRQNCKNWGIQSVLITFPKCDSAPKSTYHTSISETPGSYDYNFISLQVLFLGGLLCWMIISPLTWRLKRWVGNWILNGEKMLP